MLELLVMIRDYLIVVEAILAILGGLKVLSRYTKTTIDDRIIEILELPLRKLVDFLRRK